MVTAPRAACRCRESRPGHDAGVRAAWTGLDGEACHGSLTGSRRCFQHELDHLDGIVTLMRIDEAQRAKLELEYAP